MHRPLLTETTSSRRPSRVTRRKKLHSLIVGRQPAAPILAGRITFPLLLLTAGMVVVQPCAGQSGSWTPTGSLAEARYYHTATLLPNGKGLVAGGYNDTSLSLASAELYDATSGTWMATGSLAEARYSHTATLLPNGKVLAAGGYNFGELASAELYDPESGSWTATGSLATARWAHTATLLTTGKVLVAGGYNGDWLASAELYDPASGTWTTTGSLANRTRRSHGDVAAQRQGARRRRLQRRRLSSERGTLRSGNWDLDGHWRPRQRTRWAHGDFAAQR